MVFVVWGCVPEGEALGSGVMVAVGCGVVGSGVTVAVGRGPAGMLGLVSGWTSSSGDSAETAAVASNASAIVRGANKFRITSVS